MRRGFTAAGRALAPFGPAGRAPVITREHHGRRDARLTFVINVYVAVYWYSQLKHVTAQKTSLSPPRIPPCSQAAHRPQIECAVERALLRTLIAPPEYGRQLVQKQALGNKPCSRSQEQPAARAQNSAAGHRTPDERTSLFEEKAYC